MSSNTKFNWRDEVEKEKRSEALNMSFFCFFFNNIPPVGYEKVVNHTHTYTIVIWTLYISACT